MTPLWGIAKDDRICPRFYLCIKIHGLIPQDLVKRPKQSLKETDIEHSRLWSLVGYGTLLKGFAPRYAFCPV